MDDKAILRAEGLAAGYGGRAVVRDVELAAAPGELLTLIGPNGAGKSTVLKTLAGLLPPAGGAVLLSGAPLASLPAGTLARKLAIVTTERMRGERMTCRDVAAMGRYPYTGRLGILSERDNARVEEAMALCRVTELRERSFEQISDGQRQRVLLSRAICQEPEVLLLDEPTSFLDIRHKLEFLTALRRLARERGIAVVLSLHEPELAARISDRILRLRDGRAERAGAPAELLTDAAIEELYGMERGSYSAFFGRPAGSASFFQNRFCPSFPCHKGVDEADFNCLFCYCPLYALGARCGGGFRINEKGVKTCVDCALPHVRANYRRVLDRWPELSALAAGAQKESSEEG